MLSKYLEAQSSLYTEYLPENIARGWEIKAVKSEKLSIRGKLTSNLCIRVLEEPCDRRHKRKPSKVWEICTFTTWICIGSPTLCSPQSLDLQRKLSLFANVLVTFFVGRILSPLSMLVCSILPLCHICDFGSEAFWESIVSVQRWLNHDWAARLYRQLCWLWYKYPHAQSLG